MAFNLGDIFLTLKMKTEELQRGMSEVQKFGAGVESKLGGMNTAFAASAGLARTMATGMAIAGTAVAALGAIGLKSTGEFEQSRVAFETMLGSADKAGKLMKEIALFAKTTPFELPEVVAASKQLLAFGIAQDNIIPTMRKLGDIASGVGVPVGQLSYVFGQVRVAGKMMGQDLMQFTNAGVPMIEALANTMKKPQSEIKNLVEQGKIGFPEVEAAINSLTGESSKFGGMMEKQSHTFNGVVSNIKDGFGQMLRSAMGMDEAGNIVKGGLFDRIKDAAAVALPVMQQTFNAIGAGLTWLDQHRGVVAAAAGMIAAVVIPAFVAWAFAAGAAAAATLAAVWPILAIGAAVGTIAYLITSHWQQITDGFSAMQDFIVAGWNSIMAAATNAWNGIWNAIKPIIDTLVAAGQAYFAIYAYIFAVIRGLAIVAWQEIYNFIKPAIDGIGAALGWLGGVASGAWNGIASGFKWAWGQVTSAWNAAAGFFGGIWAKIAEGASGVGNAIANAVGGAFNAVAGVVKSVVNWMIDKVNGVIRGINSSAGKLPGVPDLSQIPRLAKGMQNFVGGLALVGESGPELIRMPRGSDVFTANRTRQMMAGASRGGGDIHVHLDGATITSPLVADQYAEIIGDGIVRRLQQQASIMN